MKKLLVSVVSVALVLLMGFAVGCAKTNTPALRIRLVSGGQNVNGVYTYQCEEGETSHQFRLSVDTWKGETSGFSWKLGEDNIGSNQRTVTFDVEAGEAKTVTLTYTYGEGEEKIFGGDTTATATIQVWVKAYQAPTE